MTTTSVAEASTTPDRMPVLKAKYDYVRATARRVESVADDVVAEYSGDLDTFIYGIEEILDDLRENPKHELSGADLERMVMRLPIIMYRLSQLMDRAAIESDCAKAATKIVYATQYANAEGTIPDKTNAATLATAEETLIVDIAKHVHLKIKAKQEMAMAMFDAVRKVMTSREGDKQMGRRDR